MWYPTNTNPLLLSSSGYNFYHLWFRYFLYFKDRFSIINGDGWHSSSHDSLSQFLDWIYKEIIKCTCQNIIINIPFTVSSGKAVLCSLFLPVILLRFLYISFPRPCAPLMILIKKTPFLKFLSTLFRRVVKASLSLLCPDFRALFKAESLSFICFQIVSLSHGKVLFCPCLCFTFRVKVALISLMLVKKLLQLFSVSSLVNR